MRVYEKLEYVQEAQTLGDFGRVADPSLEEMEEVTRKWVQEHPVREGKMGIINFGIAATQS